MYESATFVISKTLPSVSIVVVLSNVPPNSTSSPSKFKPLETLTDNETAPDEPPPVNPAPAVTADMSPALRTQSNPVLFRPQIQWQNYAYL